MIIIDTRVTISQGSVKKQGDVHSDDFSDSESDIDFTPEPNTPIQKVWWSPLANLPGFENFRSIRVQREALDSGDMDPDWTKARVFVKSKTGNASKIAIQLYAVAADAKKHDGTSSTSIDLTQNDLGLVHHNNNAAVGITLTLPKARPRMRGAELFFHVRQAGQEIKIIPSAAGANPDALTVDGTDQAFIRSSTADALLAVKWQGRNVWRVSDRTANWAVV